MILKKSSEGPVVRPLGPDGKITGGQLVQMTVIFDALTANSLARAGFIAAIAFFQMVLFFAFHGRSRALCPVIIYQIGTKSNFPPGGRRFGSERLSVIMDRKWVPEGFLSLAWRFAFHPAPFGLRSGPRSPGWERLGTPEASPIRASPEMTLFSNPASHPGMGSIFTENRRPTVKYTIWTG